MSSWKPPREQRKKGYEVSKRHTTSSDSNAIDFAAELPDGPIPAELGTDVLPVVHEDTPEVSADPESSAASTSSPTASDPTSPFRSTPDTQTSTPRPPSGPRGRHRQQKKRHPVLRGIGITVGVLALIASFWTGWTMQATAADMPGAPKMVMVATWARDNNLGWFVARTEEVYYATLHRAPEGGVPTLSADINADGDAGAIMEPQASESPETQPTQPDNSTQPSSQGTQTVVAPTPSPEPSVRAHLDPPATMTSPAKQLLEKEGQWQPVGTKVDGIPAVYIARVRPDADHTSLLTSVMWIDTSLSSMFFVPGNVEPGGPSPYGGGLPESEWPNVLANWNGGFRLKDTHGGYYFKGETVGELTDDVASAVIYKDGTMRIGLWGRDVKMTDQVLVVRQNRDLIVDGGKSQTSDDDIYWQWGGPAVSGATTTFRSGMGQRADGSLIYVAGPYLTAPALADLMVRAGVEYGMVLDMNDYWAAGYYFQHDADGNPICKKMDPSMPDPCERFLHGFERDSFNVIAKPE